MDASPPFQSSGASALRCLPPAGCPSNGETVVRVRKKRSDKRSDERRDERRDERSDRQRYSVCCVQLYVRCVDVRCECTLYSQGAPLSFFLSLPPGPTARVSRLRADMVPTNAPPRRTRVRREGKGRAIQKLVQRSGGNVNPLYPCVLCAVVCGVLCAVCCVRCAVCGVLCARCAVLHTHTQV